MPLDIVELVVIFVFLGLSSIFCYRKKLLDAEGVFIANAVGLAAITYGPNPMVDFFTVVAFFIIGQIASNYPKKKHGQRTASNVLGNSLPALVALILIIFYPKHQVLLEFAFFGAISAALADTLSSEVGYYSKSNPVLITSLKKVEKGTDGGITKLGEFAALIGGIVIATIYFWVYNNLWLGLILVFAGILGSNVDSIFGAVFERKKVLNKTHVNIIGSTAGAISCVVLALLTGLI